MSFMVSSPSRTTAKLTQRQNDVLRVLLDGGKSDKAIAFELGLTCGTVKVYFGKLRAKLTPPGMSRVGIALWAERSGLFREND